MPWVAGPPVRLGSGGWAPQPTRLPASIQHDVSRHQQSIQNEPKPRALDNSATYPFVLPQHITALKAIRAGVDKFELFGRGSGLAGPEDSWAGCHGMWANGGPA